MSQGEWDIKSTRKVHLKTRYVSFEEQMFIVRGWVTVQSCTLGESLAYLIQPLCRLFSPHIFNDFHKLIRIIFESMGFNGGRKDPFHKEAVKDSLLAHSEINFGVKASCQPPGFSMTR